jgi:hypothetical protein
MQTYLLVKFRLQKNQADFANWAWLFIQLIYLGVVDPDTDQLLFTTVIDMLAVLIHHLISLEPNLEVNKFYQLIVKKISKETKDFNDIPNSKAINQVSDFSKRGSFLKKKTIFLVPVQLRRLLPLNRTTTTDLIAVESYNTVTTKTNTVDRRRGFKFARKVSF